MANIMHLTQQDNATEAELLARPIATNHAGHWYYASDVERYYYAGTDGTLIKGLAPEDLNPDFVRSVAGTDSMGLVVDANGELTANVKIDAANNNVAQVTAQGVYVPDIQIAAGSSALLDYDAATRSISVKQLLVSDVTVNETEADLAAYVTANYTGTEQQKGDVVILTQENKAYIHNGGTAGDATDFSLIETPGLSDAAIRSLFTGDDVINYDPSTGNFSFNLDDASDSSVSVSAAGLKVIVKDGEVTDTNDILGGGVSEVSLQSLLDGTTNLAKSAIQSYTVAGDEGTTTFDKTDTSITYTGGSLLKTAITEVTPGEVVVKSSFDTTGATSGQIIKLIDDGSGVLVPTWTVDSASGFQEHSVPFAAADGTLVEDNDSFRYLNTENRFLINLPDSEKVDANDVRFASNFSIRYSGGDNGGTQPHENTYLNFRASVLEIGTQDVNYANPIVNFRPGVVDATGARTEFQVGQNLGGLMTTPEIGALKMTGTNVSSNTLRTKLMYSKVTAVQGSIANGDHKVESGTTFQTRNFSDVWNNGHDVMTLAADSSVTLHGYENGGVANFLGTDATGKVITHTNYLPAAIGAENQILKVDANGALVWAEDTAGAFQGADNGATFNQTTGNVELGGALIKNTAIDLATFNLDISDTAGDTALFVGAAGVALRTAPFEFFMGTDANGVKFKDNRAGALATGMVYDADYSTNFVNESLITKRYVDTQINAIDTTTYVVENGLTAETDGGADTIKLGGALVENTAIDLADNSLTINSSANGLFTANTDMYFGATGQSIVIKSPNGTQWRLGVTDFGAATFSSLT